MSEIKKVCLITVSVEFVFVVNCIDTLTTITTRWVSCLVAAERTTIYGNGEFFTTIMGYENGEVTKENSL